MFFSWLINSFFMYIVYALKRDIPVGSIVDSNTTKGEGIGQP